MGWFGKSKKNKNKPPSSFKDKHLAQAPQAMGQNSANQVYKTTYDPKRAFNDGETTGFFKPDGDMAPAKNAVGASRLATAMGWDHIIPETKFATHDVTDLHGTTTKGVKGAVSKTVVGESLMGAIFDEEVPNYTGSGNDWTKKSTDGKWYKRSGDDHSDVDLSASHTQQQLNQLQWFDALIGNSDRHGGNIIVDPITGNVSGIDNDLSFAHDQAIQAYDDTGNISESFTKGANDKFLGLPQQLDEETASSLLALTPKQLKKVLNPKGTKKDQKFSKQELQQTYDRLAVIQSEVKKKENAGALLKGWDANTYQTSLDQTFTGGYGQEGADYVQRQHSHLNAARDTSNPYEWVRGKRQQSTTPPAPVSTSLSSSSSTPPPAPTTAPKPKPAPVLPSPLPVSSSGTGVAPSGPSQRSAPPSRRPPPIPSGNGGGATATKPKARPVMKRAVGTPWEHL